MVASTTHQTLQRIAEEKFPADQFVRVRNSVIFCEHEAKNSKGEVQKYDKSALDKIARRCNERIADTGDFAALAAGHTPDRDELVKGMPMPDVLGFVGPFRVAKFGERKPRWAILADEWQFKEDREKLRKLPRRSVELWMAENMDDRLIDPVAALGAETPRLDTGLRFTRMGDTVVEKYTAVAPAAGNTFVKNFGEPKKENYAVNDQEKRELLDAIFQTQEFQWIREQMDTEESAVPEEGPVDELAIPEDVPPVDMGVPAEDEENFDMMSKKGPVEKYRQEVEKYRQENEALRSSIDSILKDAADSKREARIARLSMTHAVPVDELHETCLYSKGSTMDDKTFDAHLTTVEKYAQQMPETGRRLPVGDLPPSQGDSAERHERDKAEWCINFADAKRGAGEKVTYAMAAAEYEKEHGKAV